MTDQTANAEALIRAMARAFYEDSAVCLIDVLIQDKFLRDDDMGSRLSLPPKQMRKTLQFLQEEHLVKWESVDDLAEGGSQATKFWYIDYNHAVNVIRLRIYLLRKKLEEAELRARSSSMYLCPGYKTKACNGRYTETEAQQVIDPETGLFLCQECVNAHAANPDPPSRDTYTLRLLDNTRDLKLAMDNIRRVNVQLSAKIIGNKQLRPGIYDLLQKVRSKGAGPLTSNLPSENRAMNIGSTRLAGTGRTAGIKAKKLRNQMGEGALDGDSGSVRKYLGGTTRTEEGTEDDLTFLKNAMGQQIAFEVEKGGGARANLLATRGRRRSKLLDAAASRVGVELDLVSLLALRHRKKREEEEADDEKTKKKRELKNATLSFLRNNIGRLNDGDDDDGDDDSGENAKRRKLEQDESDDDDEEDGVVIEEEDDFAHMTDEERRATFQAYYKKEMARQKALMFPRETTEGGTSDGLRIVSDANGEDGDNDESILWEDG